jgi:hypothetical protein
MIDRRLQQSHNICLGISVMNTRDAIRKMFVSEVSAQNQARFCLGTVEDYVGYPFRSRDFQLSKIFIGNRTKNTRGSNHRLGHGKEVRI